MQAGRFLREDQGAVGDAVKAGGFTVSSLFGDSILDVWDDADDATTGLWFQLLHANIYILYTHTYIRIHRYIHNMMSYYCTTETFH